MYCNYSKLNTVSYQRGQGEREAEGGCTWLVGVAAEKAVVGIFVTRRVLEISRLLSRAVIVKRLPSLAHSPNATDLQPLSQRNGPPATRRFIGAIGSR